MNLRDYQEEAVNGIRRLLAMGRHRPLCVLPCGAGKTVLFAFMAKTHAEKDPSNRVLFLVHRRELVDQTLSAFSKVEVPVGRVSVSMVQTVARHLDETAKPTLIVVDEAHHSASATYRKIISQWPSVPLVGLTATPCRLDGKPLGGVFDSMYVGVSAKWLEAHGWLCLYDYYAPKVSLPDAEFKPKGSDFDTEDADRQLTKAGIFGDVLKYLDPKRKTIVYAPTVSMSKRIAEEIDARYPGLARHFDGDTPKAEREETVRLFREGTVRVLCNRDLIGEGFDVPDCDCVMELRPTKSVALYIQQSMRCMRPAPGKRAVIYDFVGNVFRHGMPDDPRKWSLSAPMKARNPNGAKDVLCRQCNNCLRTYPGLNRICPFCGFDNGKTRREIEQDRKADLALIKAVQRDERRNARSFDELVELGRKRGYKNPRGWAWHIIVGRGGWGK